MIKIYYRHDIKENKDYYLIFIENSGIYHYDCHSLMRVANRDCDCPIDKDTIEGFAVSRDFHKAYEKQDDPLTKEWFNEFKDNEEMRIQLKNRIRQSAKEVSTLNSKRVNLQDYLITKYMLEILAL